MTVYSPRYLADLLAQLPALIASTSLNINDSATSGGTQTYSINKILALIAAVGGGDMFKADNLSGLANYATARTNLGATAVGSALFTATDAAAGRLALALGTAALATLDNDGALTSNSATAVATQQAVRSFVEGKVAGIAWKPAVRAATTTATSLASVVPGFVMDTVTLAAGDDFLDKDNSDQTLRGIYTVQASGAPVRRADANTIARLVNATVYVSEGAAVSAGGNLDTQWTCTVNKSATLGTSPLIWVRTGAGGVLLGTDVGTIVQAYDADLAAIAALTTTTFGRDFLALVDAAAARTKLGVVIGTDVQAYDSDLAAIAALTTTAIGRSLLAIADAAAGRSILNAASLAANTFTGKQSLPASTTAASPLNLGSGTAPTSPVDGDVWVTSAGIYVRINGITVGPLSAGGGGTALREQTITVQPNGNGAGYYYPRTAQTIVFTNLAAEAAITDTVRVQRKTAGGTYSTIADVANGASASPLSLAGTDTVRFFSIASSPNTVVGHFQQTA